MRDAFLAIPLTECHNLSFMQVNIRGVLPIISGKSASVFKEHES